MQPHSFFHDAGCVIIKEANGERIKDVFDWMLDVGLTSECRKKCVMSMGETYVYTFGFYDPSDAVIFKLRYGHVVTVENLV
jgi:hypothetical protein